MVVFGRPVPRRRARQPMGFIFLVLSPLIVLVWLSFLFIEQSSHGAVDARNAGRSGANVITDRHVAGVDGGVDDDDAIKITIGIKTAEIGVHGQRLPQIQRTWMKDALDAGIDIKFFTSSAEEKGTIGSGAGADALGTNLIHTPCPDNDLCCKNEHMFAYFLEHGANGTASYFCSFDDDNYVLVKNLIRVLSSYHDGPKKGKDIYIGRWTWRDGIPNRALNMNIQFATGGAGYCLSRDVVEQGRESFLSLGRICRQVTHAADDITVGYVVQEKVGAELITDQCFLSHLQHVRRTVDRNRISEKVAYGYDNKQTRENAKDCFPNVPILFSEEDDPMLFRSLHCFLNEGKDGVDSSDCKVTGSKQSE